MLCEMLDFSDDFNMSKRRSMSVLSASQANTRSSMSLVSDGTPHLKSSATRKSLGGGGGASRSASRDRDSGVRRSGAFMKGSSVRSDPRPLGDKPFQQACIRSLIGFLTANGYDHAVSPKLLASPTAKEFMHIVQFLFRKVPLAALTRLPDASNGPHPLLNHPHPHPGGKPCVNAPFTALASRYRPF